MLHFYQPYLTANQIQNNSLCNTSCIYLAFAVFLWLIWTGIYTINCTDSSNISSRLAAQLRTAIWHLSIHWQPWTKQHKHWSPIYDYLSDNKQAQYKLESTHRVQTSVKMPHFPISKNGPGSWSNTDRSQNFTTSSTAQCSPFHVIWFKSNNKFLTYIVHKRSVS